jgi:hypothetical protein
MSNSKLSMGKVAKKGYQTTLRTVNTALEVTNQGLKGVAAASKALHTTGKTVADASKIVSDAAAIGSATTGAIQGVLERQETKIQAKTAQIKAESQAKINALSNKNVQEKMGKAAQTKLVANQAKLQKNATSRQKSILSQQKTLNVQIKEIQQKKQQELLEIEKKGEIETAQLKAELEIRKIEQATKNQSKIINAEISSEQQKLNTEQKKHNSKILLNQQKNNLIKKSIDALKEAQLILIKKESKNTLVLLKSLSYDICGGRSYTGYHFKCKKRNIYEDQYKNTYAQYTRFYDGLGDIIGSINNNTLNKISNTIKTKIVIIRELNSRITQFIIQLKRKVYKNKNNNIIDGIEKIQTFIEKYQNMLDDIHNNNKNNNAHNNTKKIYNSTNKLEDALSQSSKSINNNIGKQKIGNNANTKPNHHVNNTRYNSGKNHVNNTRYNPEENHPVYNPEEN